jgi:hypothetical protein
MLGTPWRIQVKKSFLLFAFTVAFCCCTAASGDPQSDTASEVIAIERKAMDGWVRGNPDPSLAVSDVEITYFHAITEKRIDGISGVKALFDQYRGRPLYDSYDMIEPKVQGTGDLAVLTYILVQRNGSIASRWNATQVYQKKREGWRLIHSHWSQTAPPIAPAR